MAITGQKVSSFQKQSKVEVTESSTTVVAANEARNGIILTNDSTVKVYLGFGQAAVLKEAIVLSANGGAFICGGEGFVPTTSITAIAPSGTTNVVTILEW